MSQKLALEYKVPSRLEMARDGRDQPKENAVLDLPIYISACSFLAIVWVAASSRLDCSVVCVGDALHPAKSPV